MNLLAVPHYFKVFQKIQYLFILIHNYMFLLIQGFMSLFSIMASFTFMCTMSIETWFQIR